MKSTKTLAVAVLAVFAASCSAMRVHTDHDPSADLKSYHTYQWVSPVNMPGFPSMQKGGPPYNEQFLSDPVLAVKVERAIGGDLTKAGFSQAKGGTPDMLVGFYTVTQNRVWISNWDGWGYPWYWGWGPSYAEVRPEGSLVLVFFDARTKRPIWTGRASGLSENPQKNDRKIVEAVSKMLQDFQRQA